MYVEISKNAELYYIALGDIWAAEKTCFGNPNVSVHLCTQAVEKIMKAFLRHSGESYDHGHSLNVLLEHVEDVSELPYSSVENIALLSEYSQSLRYKNSKSDPTSADAKKAITCTKEVLQSFSEIPSAMKYISEAKEVHAKMLKVAEKEEFGQSPLPGTKAEYTKAIDKAVADGKDNSEKPKRNMSRDER
ncbi:MAG: HEPN domain-containing protein [Oscillospiraceae bacterium]|nr:HEPN domain-containing protein [Oscillospiraceae bacterium]MCL2279876.1 HEPN domain-containing protein [Oscillospiraceae bacterium]